MRKFNQLENLIIAENDFIKTLSEKDSAKLLLISDSHGSKNILSTIVKEYGKECDALCFCGDGMPDLLEMLEDFHWNPFDEKNIPPAIIFVQGNGDNSNYSLLTDDRIFISVPQQIDFLVAGKRILMTHGHRYNVYIGTKELKNEAERIGASIVFYGHTHIANAQLKTNSKTKEKLAILNPGSCSLPRGGLPHTFAIIKIDKNKEKIEHDYFEIRWASNGDVEIIPYTPPTGEINLFW